jgi:hypothetical protein
MRETFGPTGQKVTREPKKLETVERHDLHCSSDINGVRGVSMWHVGDGPTRPWWGNLKEGDQIEDLGLGSEDNIKMDLK